MLRFLILLALTVYVISKIGSFFFRAGISSQQGRNPGRETDRAHANPSARKDRKPGNIKGGEYVDYEEIK